MFWLAAGFASPAGFAPASDDDATAVSVVAVEAVVVLSLSAATKMTSVGGKVDGAAQRIGIYIHQHTPSQT